MNSVTLNVGGIHFTTTKATLMAQESMLQSLFSDRFPLQLQSDGSVFIDRDGTHFRYVLNFLRDGHIEIPQDTEKLAELIREAEYYSLTNMVNFLSAAYVDEQALKGKKFHYKGNWKSGSSNPGWSYKFKIVLSRKEKEAQSTESNIVPVEGAITWTLLECPPYRGSYLAHRVGDSGREFVEGTFKINERLIAVKGIKMDTSAQGLIALDEYKLTVSEDGNSFEGITQGNSGAWDNKIHGKARDLIKREKIAQNVNSYREKKK